MTQQSNNFHHKQSRLKGLAIFHFECFSFHHKCVCSRMEIHPHNLDPLLPSISCVTFKFVFGNFFPLHSLCFKQEKPGSMVFSIDSILYTNCLLDYKNSSCMRKERKGIKSTIGKKTLKEKQFSKTRKTLFTLLDKRKTILRAIVLGKLLMFFFAQG